jgi:hypothetical protein
MPWRQKMNSPKKLALSKETLRCLDDQDLTGVVGGCGRQGNGGGSNDCHNSNDCGNSNAAICISEDCQSVGICDSVLCVGLV